MGNMFDNRIKIKKNEGLCPLNPGRKLVSCTFL